jgi:uncharacterized protein (DUF2141 family)
MRGVLFFLMVFLPVLLLSQYRLEVEAVGVASSEGSIEVAIYREEAGFLKTEYVYRNAGAQATEGMTRVVFESLPEGQYALAVFHDENGNDELDTNWIGIPKEPFGFSRARMKTFGPPKFHECVITLNEDLVVQVPLE